MILGAIKDWVFNFWWDSFNRIFIFIIDNALYSLIGFFYKVFLIIGSFDLFGGYTSDTASAMQIYQDFTKRIYSVIGIIVMFILAYQIILFVIDPDKGLKESKKLVYNIIKGIILTIIAPLVFHYLAQIQYHVLVSDNVIWNIVLGEGASSSSNVIESGNTMASMLFVSVFHPVGTQYSDFYDNDGSLKSSSEACSSYLGGNMSQDTIARTFVVGATGAAIGFVIGGPIGAAVGGAIGAIIGFMNDAANAVSTCDFYYWILYQAGLPPEKRQSVKPNEVDSLTNYADSKVGYSNKASFLAANTALIDEIAQENNMEYYYFSPVGAIAIMFFLIAYTLDIAVRVFKMAFLQMIAPVPILLGTIPKNEKIYTTWRDRFIKTYLDIFVRVFVMAFIALMIKLLPSFIDAMMAVFSSVSKVDEGNGLLKCVTYFALILGLLRAAKEVPEMIMDLAKNGGGLLSSFNLNPLDSYKKTSKPMGAIGGAALGGIAGGFNAFKRSKGKTFKGRVRDALSGSVRGTVSGGKYGYQNGFGKGALTKTLNSSYSAVSNGIAKRDAIESALKNGNVKDALDYMNKGRFSKFKSAFLGDMEGNQQYFDAATQFDQVASAGKAQYSEGVDAYKTSLNSQRDEALNAKNSVDLGFRIKIGDKEIIAKDMNALNTEVSKTILKTQQDVFANGVKNNDGSMTFSYNGQTYTSKDGSADSIRAIKEQIRNQVSQDFQYDAANAERVGQSDFNGKLYTGTYEERRTAINKDIKEYTKNLELSNLTKTYEGASGVDIARQLSKQQKDVYMQNSDLLNQKQRDSISDKLRESIEKSTVLTSVMDIKDSEFGNVRSVLSKISDGSWDEQLAGLSEEQRATFYKELANVQHTMTTSMAAVAKDAKKLKDASSGLEKNRFNGQEQYSLGSSPKNSDKK